MLQQSLNFGAWNSEEVSWGNSWRIQVVSMAMVISRADRGPLNEVEDDIDCRRVPQSICPGLDELPRQMSAEKYK